MEPTPLNPALEGREGEEERWDLGDRILYCGDLAWLLKEFGWILLVPWVALPSGVMAAGCAGFAAASHWRRPVEEFLPELTAAIWLSANVVWMVDDVFWDTPDQQTPWAMTPIEPENEALYGKVEVGAMLGFLLGPVLFAIGIIVCGLRWVMHPTPRRRHTVVSLGLSSYLATWCLKDFFWTLELLWPALLADILTIFLLLASSAVLTGQGLRGVDRSDLAWLSWIVANCLWLLCELAYDGNLTARYWSAGVSLAAFVQLSVSYQQVKQRACNLRARAAVVTKGQESSGVSGDPASEAVP